MLSGSRPGLRSWAAVVGTVAVAAVAVIWPEQYAPLLLLASFASASAAWRREGRSRFAWACWSAAFASSAVAQLLWVGAERWPTLEFPAWGLYNLYYPFTVFGALALRVPSEDGPARFRKVLDVGGIALSSIALVWYFGRSAQDQPTTWVTGVGETMVLASAAAMLHGPARSLETGVRSVGVALFTLALGDLLELGSISGRPALAVASRVALAVGTAMVVAAAAFPPGHDASRGRGPLASLVLRTATQLPILAGGVVFAMMGMAVFLDQAALPVLAGVCTLLCTVTIVRLVLEQQALDQELATRAQREEERMRAQRLAVLGEVTGTVVHDVNNLLAVMVMCADELAATTNGSEALRDLQHATRRGTEVCSRLVGYARSGGGLARIEAVDLRTFLRELRPVLSRVMPGAVSVSVPPDDIGPMRILADPARLELALLNLLVNSRDATNGAGRVDVRLAPWPDERCPGAVIEVEDDGPGMDAPTLSRASTPFFTTKPTGTGLGLASVRATVQDLGGAFAIDSAPGRGTRIRLRVPLMGPDDAGRGA